MKKKGKGGEVLFPASLRHSLAGTVSEAVETASRAGIQRPGANRRGLSYISWLCQRHMILVREGALIERNTEGRQP